MKTFLAIFLPLIVAYADTCKWIWDRWLLDGSYYSHGPLLPILALIVLWYRRQAIGQLPLGIDLRGWWLLGPGIFLRLVGAAQTVDSISGFSLVLTLPGACWLALGAPRMRALLPVLLLTMFATPLPMDLTGRIAFELKEFAIDGATVLGNLLGLGAVRHGAILQVGTETLEVADACGGLRSLLALITLGYCLAFFLGSARSDRRVIILLATVPLAVFTNIVRIVGLCFLAKSKGALFAGSTAHGVMNFLAWALDLALLLALDFWLDRRRLRGEDK